MASKSVGMFQRPVEYRARGKVLRMPQHVPSYYGSSYNYTTAFSKYLNRQVSCIDCGDYEDATTNKTVCDYYSYYEIYPAPSSIPTSDWQMQVIYDSKISEDWVLDKYINFCTQNGTYIQEVKPVLMGNMVYPNMVKDFFIGFLEYKEKIVVDEAFIYMVGSYFTNYGASVEEANQNGVLYYNTLYEAFYLEVFDYAKKILAQIYQKDVITKAEFMAFQAENI